jgi:VWFA-related protein
MRIRNAAVASGFAAWLACAAASAHLNGQPVTGQNPPLQTPPTFRAGTTSIEVDVSVRDKDRRFVPDLKLEDFEVFEDGAPQEVSVVYRVLGPNEPAPAGAAAAVPDLPAPPPQQVQRVIVLNFDQAHLAPGGFDRARKAALDFIKRDFRDDDVGGVVNGGTMMNNRLTSSREELEAALAAIKPAPESNTVTRELRQWPRFADLYEAWRLVRNEPANEAGAKTVLDQVVRRACLDQPSSCERGGAVMVEADVQNKATLLVSRARILGKQTMDTIAGLANGLARLPGRKTVILLTEGFFVESSWADLRDVVGRAARASVRIYALDTRGLNRGSASSDIFSSANPAQVALAQPTAGDTAADGPNSLAVDTGGYVIRNENDFGKAFTEIDRDTSSYYVLGFRTARPLDGKFRTIDVKVKRAGVTVRARKGYMATPDMAKVDGAPGMKPGEAEAPAPAVPEKPAEAAVPPAARPAGEAAAVPAAAPEAMGGVRMRPDMARQVTALGPRPGAGSTASFPDALRKQATQGWEAYQRGDVAAARALLEGAAANPAAPPWIVYVLGWTQSSASEPKEAAASWERVRSSVPEFSAVYFDLADAYLQQREFGKAVAVLRQAEARWANDVDVYNALGVVQLARGALDDAIETFARGVGVNAGDPTANYNLAKSCELRFVRASRQRRAGASSVPAAGVLQDRDRAIEHYKRTIQAGGQFVEQAREGLKRLGAQ